MLREAVYSTADALEWRSALSDQDSAFGSVEFAGVVERHLGYEARLYVLEDDTSLIAYPFLTRPVLPSLLGEGVCARASDTTSPDFTGPLARGAPSPSLALEFRRRLAAYFGSQDIVTEFIHLHPWKAFTGALARPCLRFDREIVFVDLTWPEEQIWRASFNYACRKNINRSRRDEVRVFAARTMGDVREFHRIYVDTMKKRCALEQYFYPLEYFAAIFDRLSGSARFALAEYRDRVVAGTLYLHDRDDVYSYLGGADASFQHVRPTNAIVYDTVLWGGRSGKKRLILGGGRSPNDGIFRFKASFSPHRADFLVYRRVHLSARYEALCRSWTSAHGLAVHAAPYFPPYRFQPEAAQPASPALAAPPSESLEQRAHQMGGS